MLMDFSNTDSDDPPKEIPRQLYDTPVYFRFVKNSLVVREYDIASVLRCGTDKYTVLFDIEQKQASQDT